MHPESNATTGTLGASGCHSNFGTRADFAECRRLHRAHGTTYYWSTRLFPPPIRERVHALYGFVRVPDEWADNPSCSLPEAASALCDYRAQLRRGFDGVCPAHPVLRAFCDVALDARMPLEEPLLFLDAMQSDFEVRRYATFENLRAYMRGSAVAVGHMMCAVLGAPMDAETLSAARALGEAMQLTNFLRDVREDAERGRIYLPLEDLDRFGVGEAEVLNGKMSKRFDNLMAFEIERARGLYLAADAGMGRLPADTQKPVRLARILYSRILDRIERQGRDVFVARARTTRLEKVVVLAQVLIGRA